MSGASRSASDHFAAHGPQYPSRNVVKLSDANARPGMIVSPTTILSQEQPCIAADDRAPTSRIVLPIGQRSPRTSDSAVGSEIRRLRRSQGRTQKELARAIGVTGAQLHRYETGSTRIAASRLIAIADALGVRPDVLIAAGSVHDAPPAPLGLTAGDEIVELIQVFGTICDPKHRSALIAVARMMVDQSKS